MTDFDRFDLAKNALEDVHCAYNIGTYRERSVHRTLKLYYEPCCDCHEVSFEGYVADILNEEGITEIQTAGFRNLCDKLAVFLPLKKVRVVYPVCEKKRSCWVDPLSGEITHGRFSTYKKKRFSLLYELLHIADYIGNKNLSIEVVYLSASDYKLLDGYGVDRKKRATKTDTVPEALIGIDTISCIDDIRGFLMLDSGTEHTSNDLSKHFGLSRIKLWKAIKLLNIIGILYPYSKKKNAIVYKVK